LRDLEPVAACEPASAIWSAPLVRSAGITLADVLAGTSGAAAVVAGPVDVDPQAAFVRLAERLGSYKAAARKYPEVWAAAVMAADLNGPQGVTT
jgi:hypothetical protein